MTWHLPEQHAVVVSETSAAGGARSLPVYWVALSVSHEYLIKTLSYIDIFLEVKQKRQ